MPTFHTVDFAHAQHNIVVLRHTALPFIASPAPPRQRRRRGGGDVRRPPDLATALTNLTDAQALTSEQLQTHLSQVDLSALNPHEHDQVNDWEPTTVGEPMFSFWD